MQNWLKAAERYQASKQPDFKPRRKRAKQEKAAPTLEHFMANNEGDAAKKLLAAAGQVICLGYSEAVMSRTVAVVIDGDGLKTYSGVVGMAAAYSEEEPERNPIDAARALELLRSFSDENNNYLAEGEDDLVIKLRQELDRIAADAP